MPKRKRASHDAAFKLRVIEFAENSKNCAAIREFDINEKLVKDWRRNKSTLVDTSKSEKRRVIRIRTTGTRLDLHRVLKSDRMCTTYL